MKAKGVTVWAAFNRETGECMLPTVCGWKEGAIAERDRFYQGCPIFECRLVPVRRSRRSHQRRIAKRSRSGSGSQT